MPSQRYKLIIAYRGTRYHGWQQQGALQAAEIDPPAEARPLRTIQGEIRRALMDVVRHPVLVCGSSRTDAGVHAKGQVAHFDTDQVQIPIEGLRRAINSRLPDDIDVRRIHPVPDSFDAIASTIAKRYQYVIWNSIERPVLFPDLVWHRWQQLDIDAMRRAAAAFVGEHDFASFARPGHGRENTIRRVLCCQVSFRPPRLVIGIQGTGFLWNMVRIIVGTIVEVGAGRRTPEEVGQMLLARDRQAAGPTAPAHGLYLQWVRTTDDAKPTALDAARLITAPAAPLVRPYHPADVAQIVNIARSVPECFPAGAVGAIAREVALQRGFAAVLAGRTIGFISFTVLQGIATIGWIGVLPEHQHRGVGRALVQHVIHYLRDCGVAELRVNALGGTGGPGPWERVRAFFLGLGFEEFQPALPGGSECPERVVLRKSLAATDLPGLTP